MRDNMRVVTAALLSGLCFGIYHMLYMLDHTGTMSVMVLNVFLVLAGTYGIWYCYRKYQKRGCTRKI